MYRIKIQGFSESGTWIPEHDSFTDFNPNGNEPVPIQGGSWRLHTGSVHRKPGPEHASPQPLQPRHHHAVRAPVPGDPVTPGLRSAPRPPGLQAGHPHLRPTQLAGLHPHPIPTRLHRGDAHGLPTGLHGTDPHRRPAFVHRGHAGPP